jgi:hypothetical protein
MFTGLFTAKVAKSFAKGAEECLLVFALFAAFFFVFFVVTLCKPRV